MAHICHALDCNIKVPPNLFMCKRHWYMLPKEQRDRIWATYRRGQEIDKEPSKEYLEVAKTSIDWLANREKELRNAATLNTKSA